MINISSKNLKHFEEIGNGGSFGRIFKVDEKTVYKIYKPTVVDKDNHTVVTNPCITRLRIRYYSLLVRSQFLFHTNGINDLIKQDGSFNGVSMTYIPGPTFDKIMDTPVSFKVDLSRQLLVNVMELYRFFIIPLDFKLNNIIYSDGKSQIIDLDDVLTKIVYTLHPKLMSRSTELLGKTIWGFLKENDHYKTYSMDVHTQLGRYKEYGDYSIKEISKYLNDKSIGHKILFITDDSDLDRIQELANQFGFKVVYLVDKRIPANIYTNDKETRLLELLDSYKYNNTPLYDFAKTDQIEKYPTFENVDESYILSGRDLHKVYKKTKLNI